MFGTSALARRMHVYLATDSDHRVAAYTVDREYLREPRFDGLPVVPFDELERLYPPSHYAVCVGGLGYKGVNRPRALTCARCKERGYELISYTSSLARCWESSSIGTENTLIFDRANVQPHATVGDNVFLIGSNVNHDSVVADHCWVSTGAVIAGGVSVGPYSFVGVGATIRDGVTVAPHCVIGAGAVIKHDTNEGEVYSTGATEPLDIKSWDLKDI